MLLASNTHAAFRRLSTTHRKAGTTKALFDTVVLGLWEGGK